MILTPLKKEPAALTSTLGQVIKEVRQRLGLSQEELASKAGLHRTYISNIEQGERNPSLTTLANLSAAMNLECSHLMQMVEQRTAQRRLVAAEWSQESAS